MQRAAEPPSLDSGAQLLSGGLGGLGLLTARLLVERGAAQLVLTSRSGRVQQGSEADAVHQAQVEAGAGDGALGRLKPCAPQSPQP